MVREAMNIEGSLFILDTAKEMEFKTLTFNGDSGFYLMSSVKISVSDGGEIEGS